LCLVCQQPGNGGILDAGFGELAGEAVQVVGGGDVGRHVNPGAVPALLIRIAGVIKDAGHLGGHFVSGRVRKAGPSHVAEDVLAGGHDLAE
jgi:hypothetical protein